MEMDRRFGMSNDNNTINEKEALTHAGSFHSDDVFGAALLTYINPNIRIRRVFEVPQNYEGLVFDIGKGKFDHHQEDSEIRENGVPYAAFGLLWREYGAGILGEEQAREFDESFVQPLDLSDNTGCHNVLAKMIANFNPTWEEENTISTDECFEQAKQLALTILERYIENYKAEAKGEKIVVEALSQMKDQIVVLPRCVPWKKTLTYSGAKFVVYPSNRGGYNAQGVPLATDSTELVCSFPKDWRGRSLEELKKITGIAGIRFCHNAGFLAAFDNQEDAIKACYIAMERSKQNLS